MTGTYEEGETQTELGFSADPQALGKVLGMIELVPVC